METFLCLSERDWKAKNHCGDKHFHYPRRRFERRERDGTRLDQQPRHNRVSDHNVLPSKLPRLVATMEALHNLRLDSRTFETRSRPALARRYPRDFTFYLENPFPRLFVCHYIARTERTERAGKPRHRWANPRGRESGSERVNGTRDIEHARLGNRAGRRQRS